MRIRNNVCTVLVISQIPSDASFLLSISQTGRFGEFSEPSLKGLLLPSPFHDEVWLGMLLGSVSDFPFSLKMQRFMMLTVIVKGFFS